MSEKKGFTLIEVMIVGAFATLLVVLFFIQKASVDAMDRDDNRRTAINAMYYALEEYYYPKYGYYPAEIDEEVLPVIDPQLFTDPFGEKLGSELSSYSYDAANCNAENQCKEYILRAQTEKGDTYIKKGGR